MPEEPRWVLYGMALDMALTALRDPTREMVERVRGEVKQIDKYLYACSKCGAFADRGDDFCHRCGAPLTDEAVDVMLEKWKEALDDVGRT